MTRHETFDTSSAVAATAIQPLVTGGGIMPNEPTSGTSPLRPASRIAELVAEYERWERFGWDMSDEREAAELAGDAAALERSKLGQAHAKRLSDTIIGELLQTPAADLFDLGLKARVLREEKNIDWWANGGTVDDGEKIACNIVTELLAVTGIRPMDIREENPGDFCEGYVEGKRIQPVAPAVPRLPAHGFGSFSSPAADCPAAQLAHDYARLVEQLHALDVPPSDRTAATEFMTARVLDQITAIESRAAYVPARSAEGAVFQLIMARGAVDQVLSDDNSTCDGLPEANPRADRARARIDALLFSVRHFLERTFDVDGQKLGGTHMMDEKLHPDALVDRAVAEVMSKRAEAPTGALKSPGAKPARAVATKA